MPTTALKTPADRPILAIDLGKYKCVACPYGRATGAAEFRSIDTSIADVERLVRRARPAVVVIEACARPGESATCAPPSGSIAGWPAPGARPGSTGTPSGRRAGTTPCGWPSCSPSASSRR